MTDTNALLILLLAALLGRVVTLPAWTVRATQLISWRWTP